MAFHVGQFVECLCEFQPHGPYYDEVLPKKGRIYTVRECLVAWGSEVLRLLEIRNPVRAYPRDTGEPAFESSGFRPVVDSRIAVFRELLAPIPQHEREEAR